MTNPSRLRVRLLSSVRRRGDAVALVHASAAQMPVRAPRYAITNARSSRGGRADREGHGRDARRRHRGRRRQRSPRRPTRSSSTAPD